MEATQFNAATVKNILFDFGGVFIDVDYQRTSQSFSQLGVTNFDELYAQHHANPLFEQLEKGEVSPTAFFEFFRSATGLPLSNEAITTAWNAMLGSYRISSLQWLQTIRSQYRIYLYSNTNAIHHASFTASFEQQFPGKRFDDFFVKAYYSHTCGFRKPYPASYTKLLQQEGLLAHETVFIDDTLVNIQGAAAAGLQTIHLQPQTWVEHCQL